MRLKSLPPTPVTTTKKHGVRYPWNRWFGKRTFTLTRGVDYLVETHGMRGMLYRHAANRGIRIRLRVANDTIQGTVERGSKDAR
jgi:hypothetical protein